MGAGKLIHYVQLQSSTNTTNSEDGAVEKSWATYDSVWAKVKPVSGAFKEHGNTETADATHSILIYSHEDIKESDRILFTDRYSRQRKLEIISIQDSFEETIMMMITAKEKKALS